MPVLDPLAVGAAIGLLVLVFARAALHKVTDFAGFRQTVADYRLIPDILIAPAAAALAVAEMASVVLLLVPGTVSIGAATAAVLLAFYGSAMAINLLRGRTSIDCGCGGPGQSISWILVGRNVMLIAVAGAAAAPVVPRGLGLFDMLLLPAIVAATWLLLLVAERLTQTYAHIRTVGADRTSV